MPWKEVRPMDEKLQFVSYALEGGKGISSLCKQHGISRKTGHKWIRRYNELGVDGLKDLTRAPKTSPSKVLPEVEKYILSVRNDHPAWGAPKIIAYMARMGFDDLPSISSCGRILSKYGLIKKQHQYTLTPKPSVLTEAKEPNAVWTVDYKGDFKLKDGARCYPLTITDRYSRYLLFCKGYRRTSFEEAKSGFVRTFKDYGLPSIIRSDNGVPFSVGRGLSRLAVWWIELGIKPELIAPGKPHQNGQHERMHRALKAEAINLKLNYQSQQMKLKNFKHLYNQIRPHQGINNKVPAELYYPSRKIFTDKIHEYDYPSGFKKIKVNDRGTIFIDGKRYFISHSLKHKYIGIEKAEDKILRLWFRDYILGALNEEFNRFIGSY